MDFSSLWKHWHRFNHASFHTVEKDMWLIATSSYCLAALSAEMSVFNSHTQCERVQGNNISTRSQSTLFIQMSSRSRDNNRTDLANTAVIKSKSWCTALMCRKCFKRCSMQIETAIFRLVTNWQCQFPNPIFRWKSNFRFGSGKLRISRIRDSTVPRSSLPYYIYKHFIRQWLALRCRPYVASNVVFTFVQVTLFVAKPGMLTGQLAMLTGEPSFFCVRALSDSVIARMTKHSFYALMRKYPRMILSAAHTVMLRVSPFVRQIDFALDWILIEAGKALYKYAHSFLFFSCDGTVQFVKIWWKITALRKLLEVRLLCNDHHCVYLHQRLIVLVAGDATQVVVQRRFFKSNVFFLFLLTTFMYI